jgi:Uma2 family endonuclease
MSPAPAFRHQLLCSQIIVELGIQLRNCPKCRAIIPIDWEIDEETVVQPDILILCKPFEGNRLRQAPACLFEILSPSTQRKDRGIKFQLYQEQGVPYYIMVDPETCSTEAYQLGEDGKYQPLETSPELILQLGDCQVKLDMEGIWKSLEA